MTMKLSKVIIVLSSLFILVVTSFLHPWITLFFGVSLFQTSDKPKITYGEFPFTLTYELNGEKSVIEDTIICEYEGVMNRGTAGKARKWSATLKSGREQLTLLDLRSQKEQNELKQTVLELYFYYGSGAYYMGDEKNTFAREAQGFDWIEYRYQTEEGTIGGSAYRADEAWAKYRIRLISWECAPPIKNTFK